MFGLYSIASKLVRLCTSHANLMPISRRPRNTLDAPPRPLHETGRNIEAPEARQGAVTSAAAGPGRQGAEAGEEEARAGADAEREQEEEGQFVRRFFSSQVFL